MTSQKVGLLNFSMWARLELQNIAKLNHKKLPITAEVHTDLAEMLHLAQKFILPNKADLLDRESIKQAHLDIAKLPYPITAFEATWNQDERSDLQLNGMSESRSSCKRIALCWESGEGVGFLDKVNNQISQSNPQGGIYICPIFWDDELSRWIVSHTALFMPNGSVFQKFDEIGASAISRIARAAYEESPAKTKNADVLDVVPFILCKEVFDEAARLHGGENKVLAEALVCNSDEIGMVIQACSLLNCENVESDEMKVSPKLNAKRAKAGKPPFYDYKTLAVSNLSTNSNSNMGKGKRGGVRMHLRRGHIRRLKDRNIWVKNAIIGKDSKKTMLAKDYILKSVD